MTIKHNAKLTSSEIANLWTTYQFSTMIICGVEYFLTTVEDEDILEILHYILEFSNNRVQSITEIMNEENYPLPVGFTKSDVNPGAPRLFSDTMILLYVLNMGRLSLSGESMMFSLSARDDVAGFYSQALNESKELTTMSRKLAQQKGIYTRTPHIPIPEKVDFVKKQQFLFGWFGDRRPLVGTEILNLVFNAERNALGEALITGFSQVAQSKEVRKFMERGREISSKHYGVFSSILNEEQLSSAQKITSEVSGSTTAPFSDKLMMFHIAGLIASGIGQYGVSVSVSPRRDLEVHYARLVGELAKFAEDGANIMIENGWMEEPPKAADRDELMKRKGN